MIKTPILLGASLIGLSLTTATAQAQAPAVSQTELADEVARLRAEVEALKAEIRAMRPQPATTATTTPPPSATPAAPVLVAAARPAPARDADATQIKWKGAPEFTAPGGWSFKPRGRMQFDAGYLAGPASRQSGISDGRGLTTELRRAFIGAQGTIPGGLSYRAEIDFAGNSVDWNDLYLSWEKGPVSITIGQHHNFQSLDRLTSDLFTSFTERAAFNDAFNYERRVGISAGLKTGDVIANAGVFTDDISALGADGNKNFSVDGRLVWMPRWGRTQLHLAGSGHWRSIGSLQEVTGTQYRQRPYVHSTDIRYIDTGLVSVDSELGYGLEAALIRGRFHFASEAAWLNARLPQNADATFFGGYVEIGYFLTHGDTRGYKGGVWDRTSPAHPIDQGGIGAVQLNARYDHLDLTDSFLAGGTQDAYGVSVIWIPLSYIRFTANYFHLIYDEAAIGPSHFDADSVALRAQVDF